MSKAKLRTMVVVLMLCMVLLVPGGLGGYHAQAAEPVGMAPENTVILANQADACFSQDFSVLLRRLRLKSLREK